jgi:hypothetical protein
MPKFSINIKEILFFVFFYFEEQNTVFVMCLIIVNYCIIINAYFNYIINAKHNYYISNQILREECDKHENLEVTGTATASCFKRRL